MVWGDVTFIIFESSLLREQDAQWCVVTQALPSQRRGGRAVSGQPLSLRSSVSGTRATRQAELGERQSHQDGRTLNVQMFDAEQEGLTEDLTEQAGRLWFQGH